jgi:hypothetical protein
MAVKLLEYISLYSARKPAAPVGVLRAIQRGKRSKLVKRSQHCTAFATINASTPNNIPLPLIMVYFITM